MLIIVLIMICFAKQFLNCTVSAMNLLIVFRDFSFGRD